MEMFIVGIDADCCKEVQALDVQAIMDGTAEQPQCTSDASGRMVVNGFDCESKEAVTCGNETQKVVVKADESVLSIPRGLNGET